MRNQHDATKLFWWSESLGRIELKIPGEAINDIAQSGANDEAVAYWAPRIARPEVATPDLLRECLAEFGAWEEHEMQDDATNWERLIWSAAHDLGDSDEPLDEVTQ